MLLVVLFAGCHSSRTAQQTAPEARPSTPVVHSRLSSLSPSDRARLNYIYQEATRQKLVENHSAAFDLLCHAYDICPDAPEVLYDLALYRLALRQDSLAERLFVRAAELDPQNTYYKEALASFYLQRHRTEEAQPSGWLRECSRLCYGVYVLHMFFMQPIYFFSGFPQWCCGSAVGVWLMPWAVLTVTLALSVAGTWLLLKTRVGRFLIG
jgi:hypothetical protein